MGLSLRQPHRHPGLVPGPTVPLPLAKEIGVAGASLWAPAQGPGDGRAGRPPCPRHHQIFTRSAGARYSLSPGFTPNAAYQASTLRTTPLTRK